MVRELKLHSEADKIIRRLADENIGALYHFSSIENLSGISMAQAICSKQEPESKGKWPVALPGGNAQSHRLDRSQGNWDKVNLLFSPRTPMAFNLKSTIHMCFFEISVDVACWEGVFFSNSNAASGLHKKDQGIAGLDLIDFDLVRSRPQPWNSDWIHLSQAEALVPHRIPINSIDRLTFVSKASRSEGIRLWGERSAPNFHISVKPFESWPGSDFTGFSYVSDVILSSSPNGSHMTTFNRRASRLIQATIRLEALNGTTAVAQWEPGGFVEKTDFRRTDSWEWKIEIPTKRFPAGDCFLEISLNNIRWIKVPFQVTE